MKTKFFAFTFLVATAFQATAQRSFEFGIQAGTAVYQGELNPSYFAPETFENLNPQGGVLARYNMTPQWTLEFNANFGRLSGDDKKADTEERQRRNLSFRTNIITAALQADFNLFGYEPYNLLTPFTPYVFAGVEYFNINPQAYYDGRWIDLQPLGTEGQGLAGRDAKYSLHNVAIPIGVGLRWSLTEQIAVGANFGIRKTFTDYIDDVGGTYMENTALAAGNGPLAAALGNRTGEVSSFFNYRTGAGRGGPDTDWYTFAGISVSYLMYTNKPKGERGRGRNKFGCPRWMRKKRR